MLSVGSWAEPARDVQPSIPICRNRLASRLFLVGLIRRGVHRLKTGWKKKKSPHGKVGLLIKRRVKDQ